MERCSDVSALKASRVVVHAPATSANMGPGFDCLAVAVGLYDEFTFTVLGEGPSRAVTYDASGLGQAGAGQAHRPPQGPAARSLTVLTRIPSDERNLAVRSFKAYFAEMGLRPPDVEVTCLSRIPVARGLGSSAAAIVAGITAAEAMAGQGVDVQRKLNVAARIEGHPDNTSACILGGVTVSSMVSSTVLWAKVPLALQLDTVVAVPDFTLSTAVARNVLPGSVLHSDAVFNVGRAALLVASLASGDCANLRWATEDRLHQPYRASLAPGMVTAVRMAIEAGALGSYVSGAGPSIMALVPSEADAAPVTKAMLAAFVQAKVTATAMRLAAGVPGARVLEVQG